MKPYAEIYLFGSHSVRIFDHSRAYFGDYFRVSLEASYEIPLPMMPEEPVDGGLQSPGVAVYRRFLERMAVPSAEVDSVRQTLIAEFRRNALPYLADPDFPAKFIASTVVQRTSVKKRLSVRD